MNNYDYDKYEDYEREFNPDAKPRKKTQSNKSKSKSKAKHKHEYKECVYMVMDDKMIIHYYNGSYCIHCGKVGDIQIFTIEKENGKSYTISNDEFFERFPKSKYEYIPIESVWDKYIPITKEIK